MINEEGLRDWFGKSKSKGGKKGWVNVVTGGTCASDEPGEGTPKCVSSSKRASMSKKERLSAQRRKKAADPGQQQKSGAAKPTYVPTDKPKKKMKEETFNEARKPGESPQVYADRMKKKYSGGKSKTYDPMKDPNFDHDKAERTRGSMQEAKDKPGKGSGKKDACYSKVKSRYSVWPSAYASGALVKCRKVGAANWGNKSEAVEWELDEQWAANTAAEWFVEQGLNEHGVAILTEELGLQDFVELVYELSESTMLTEARAGGVRVEPVNKSGRRVADLTKGARTRAINDLRKKKKTDRAGEGEGGSSSMKDALRSQSKVAKARPSVAKARKVQAQPKPAASAPAQKPKKRSVLDGVARQVLKGMERHKKAMNMARETGKTAAKAAKVGAKAASAFGKGVASGVKDTATAAKKVKKAVTNEEVSPLAKKYLEKALGEACWKGYEKKGMKTMFGKRYPNCVKKEEKDPFGRPGGKHGGVPKKGSGYDKAYQANMKKIKELEQKEEYDTTEWRDGYTPTEIETTNLIEPEPIKGGQLHEVERTKMQTGNLYQVIFGWRGKMMMVKLFFPDAAVPTRPKVAHALDKMYPGAQLRSYSHSVVDYDDPYINVGTNEETIHEKKEEEKYCRLCEKKEPRSKCAYGPKMWDKYTVNDASDDEKSEAASDSGITEDVNKQVEARMQSDENRKRTQMRNKMRASRLKQNKALHSEHSNWRQDMQEDMSGMSQKSGDKRSTESGAGMTAKGVAKYNRRTGGNLKTAVTTPPSKLKPGSKAAGRRKSFCARSRGWTGERGKAARRRWNC